jgi:hypothetical protein
MFVWNLGTVLGQTQKCNHVCKKSWYSLGTNTEM